jgi:hypothetical protein
MSDPDFVQDLPPPPPRKAHTMSQVEADAQYARQLAAQYTDNSYSGFGGRGQGNPPLPRKQRDGNLKPNELYEGKERSFMDGKGRRKCSYHVAKPLTAKSHTDDLPVIKENLAKGFQDTKNTINKWLKDFQKRLDGDESDDGHPQAGPSSSSAAQQQQRQNYGPSTSNQLQGIRKASEANRRSGEKDRYDADPQVLGDDFGHRLELRDDECKCLNESRGIPLTDATAPPTKPPRPVANPDLFKPAAPGSTSAKSVDTAAPVGLSAGTTTASKSGKWQPLSSVDPTPVDDHDPFSLGDSDEELPDAKKPDSPKLVTGVAASAKDGDASGVLKPAEAAVTSKTDTK